MSYGEFQQPKPPKFSLIIPPTPDKTARIDNPEAFNTLLDQKLTHEESFKQPRSHAKNMQQNKAVLKAMIDTSFIQQGAHHSAHKDLAQSEFMASSQNKENYKSSEYVNYAAAFQAGLNTETERDIKRRKKISDDHLESEEEDGSKAVTYSHNLNQFGSLISHNPFKKGAEDYQTFADSPVAHYLNSGFSSAQRELGPDVFEKTQSIMSDILKPALMISDAPDNYISNNIDTFEIHSNYHTIEKEKIGDTYLWETWTPEQSRHYMLHRDQARKNYESVIRQFTGPSHLHEAHIRKLELFDSKIQQADTKVDELYDALVAPIEELWSQINSNPQLMQDDSFFDAFQDELMDIEASAGFLESNKDALDPGTLDRFNALRDELYATISAQSSLEFDRKKYFETKALDHAKKWWENTGQHLSTGWLLPYAQMSDMAETAINESELGLKFTAVDHNPLQEKLLNDTSANIYEQDLKPFTTQGTIHASDFQDLPVLDAKIMNTLMERRIIDDKGAIINFDPSQTQLDLGFDEQTHDHIYTVLARATAGTHGFVSVDDTTVAGKARRDIRIKDPYGKTWDLPELLESANPSSKADSIDVYKHARDLYNVLLNMLETMSGDKLSTHGKLAASYTILNPETDPSYQMTLYPNAEWQQYNTAIPTDPTNSLSANDDIQLASDAFTPIETYAGWEKVSNQPLSITFSSLDKLNAYYDSIKSMVLNLEPLVSTFEPKPSDIARLKEHFANIDLKIKPTKIDQLGKRYNNHGNIVDTAIRSLTLNTGSSQSLAALKNTHAHRYSVDINTRSAVMKTEHMQQNLGFIQEKIIYKMGKDIFTTTLINRLNRNKHRRKVETYKEAKKEFDEKKFEDKKSAAKTWMKRKAKQKGQLKKYYAKIKKREMELKKQQQIERAKERGKKAAKKKSAQKK